MERYNIYIVILCIFAVTSLVEVWIEISNNVPNTTGTKVTSLVEVWIEMEVMLLDCSNYGASLPLWKCGLK